MHEPSISRSAIEDVALLEDPTEERCCCGRFRLNGPDSVWSWVVASANFLITFLMCGLGRISGILYVEFMDIFVIDRRASSLPFSTQQAARFLFGPLAGLLGQKYGVRNVTVLGGIIACLSTSMIFFYTDMTSITILWGLVFGLSTALTTTLNQISIDQNFERNRATAGGFAYSGGCVGAFFLPVIIDTVIFRYSLRDAFLLLGAILISVIPAGLLLEEPPWRQNHDDESSKQNTEGYGSFGITELKRTVIVIGPSAVPQNETKPLPESQDEIGVDFGILRENSDIVLQLLTEESSNGSSETNQNNSEDLEKIELLNELEHIYSTFENPGVPINSLLTKPELHDSYKKECFAEVHVCTEMDKEDLSIKHLIESKQIISIQAKLQKLFERSPSQVISHFPYNDQPLLCKIFLELQKLYKKMTTPYFRTQNDIQPLPESHDEIDFNILRENSEIVLQLLTKGSSNGRSETSQSNPEDLEKIELLNELEYIYSTFENPEVSINNLLTKPELHDSDKKECFAEVHVCTEMDKEDLSIKHLIETKRIISLQARLQKLFERNRSHVISHFPYNDQPLVCKIFPELQKLYEKLTKKPYYRTQNGTKPLPESHREIRINFRILRENSGIVFKLLTKEISNGSSETSQSNPEDLEKMELLNELEHIYLTFENPGVPTDSLSTKTDLHDSVKKESFAEVHVCTEMNKKYLSIKHHIESKKIISIQAKLQKMFERSQSQVISHFPYNDQPLLCKIISELQKLYEKLTKKPYFRTQNDIKPLPESHDEIDFHILRENSEIVLQLLTKGSLYGSSETSQGNPEDLEKIELINELEHIYSTFENPEVTTGNLSTKPELRDSYKKESFAEVLVCTEMNKEDLSIKHLIEAKRIISIQAKLQKLFERGRSQVISHFPYNDKPLLCKIFTELQKLYEKLTKKPYIRTKYNKPPYIDTPRKPEVKVSYSRIERISVNQDSKKHPNSFCSHIKTAVKLHLNPLFLLICLSRIAFTLTFIPVLTIIVDFAMDQGLDKSQGYYAIAALSLGDFLGRLGLGWVTDRGYLSLPQYMLIVMILLGGNTAALPFLHSAIPLLTAVLTFGVFQGSLFIRHPLLISQYMESHEQAVGMGFKNFFSGIVGFIHPVFIGYFRDRCGSYDEMFYLNAIISTAVGLTWGLELYFSPSLAKSDNSKGRLNLCGS